MRPVGSVLPVALGTGVPKVGGYKCVWMSTMGWEFRAADTVSDSFWRGMGWVVMIFSPELDNIVNGRRQFNSIIRAFFCQFFNRGRWGKMKIRRKICRLRAPQAACSRLGLPIQYLVRPNCGGCS